MTRMCSLRHIYHWGHEFCQMVGKLMLFAHAQFPEDVLSLTMHGAVRDV